MPGLQPGLDVTANARFEISFSTVSTVQNTVSCGTAEKAQWVKGLATKSDDLSWLFSSVSNDI